MRTRFTSVAKTFLFAFFLIIAANRNLYAQQILTQIDGWNAYVHLPDDYNDGTGKRYPLIVFIPGTGEVGSDASKLLVNGPAKFIASGSSMNFLVNGKVEKPIVIALQPISLWPNAYTMNVKMDSIVARYRCDLSRINVTGLSMGGWTWDNFVDNYSPVYTNRITSIVSMSSPPPDNGFSNMKSFALAGGTMWSFEGNQDLRGNDQIRDTMNKYVPGSNRYTLFVGGHCCWNTFYDPTWTENGESIYTWMLKQKKVLVSGRVPSPAAYAGNDTSTSTVFTVLSLKGAGNDPSGLPINFSWSKISGPLVTISLPSAAQTTVLGLALGTYKFELKVTNAIGLISRDTITVNDGNRILPIILTDFSAVAKGAKNVLVQWKTSSEINSANFILEKSSGNSSFSQLANVLTKGSANIGATYNYLDLFPDNGANFYRLKMIDKDGKFEYSKVVSVTMRDVQVHTEFESAAGTSNTVSFKINSTNLQPCTINIIDAQGRKLYTGFTTINPGTNTISKSIILPKGVYYAILNTDNQKIAKAFIMQ